MRQVKITEKEIENLFEIISSLKTVEDCRDLFEDLCTRKEIEQMAQRIESAKLLSNGLTYSQIIERTNISSATLSRISKAIQYGNGYKKVLSKK